MLSRFAAKYPQATVAHNDALAQFKFHAHFLLAFDTRKHHLAVLQQQSQQHVASFSRYAAQTPCPEKVEVQDVETASAIVAPSGNFASKRWGIPNKDGAPIAHLGPDEFEISALSSISITTANISPLFPARRSRSEKSRSSPVQRDDASVGPLAFAGKLGVGTIHRMMLIAAFQSGASGALPTSPSLEHPGTISIATKRIRIFCPYGVETTCT